MRPMPGNTQRSGAALLVILFVVMAVTVLSMAFLSNAHMQMACGQNLASRTRIDYLAEAGLVHAKTLLLHPEGLQANQVGPDGYWQGGTGLFVEAGDDYYDVTVTRSASGSTFRCTYDIECQAYRLDGAAKVVRSGLAAQLRLDPCIAYWAGSASSLPGTVTINGDVYCGGALNSVATINGDVFADSFTGTKTGQTYASIALTAAGFSFPEISPLASFFSPVYNYAGLMYPSQSVTDFNTLPDPLVPAGSNPAGILYRSGDIEIARAVTINGTVVVDGNLTIRDGAVTITPAKKNYPALVVNGTLTVQGNAQLNVSGLVRVNRMTVAQTAGDISMLGGLFVRDAGVEVDPLYAGNLTVIAAPALSAVKLYSQSMVLIRWSPAADAFFKYVKRN